MMLGEFIRSRSAMKIWLTFICSVSTKKRKTVVKKVAPTCYVSCPITWFFPRPLSFHNIKVPRWKASKWKPTYSRAWSLVTEHTLISMKKVAEEVVVVMSDPKSRTGEEDKKTLTKQYADLIVFGTISLLTFRFLESILMEGRVFKLPTINPSSLSCMGEQWHVGFFFIHYSHSFWFTKFSSSQPTTWS